MVWRQEVRSWSRGGTAHHPSCRHLIAAHHSLPLPSTSFPFSVGSMPCKVSPKAMRWKAFTPSLIVVVFLFLAASVRAADDIGLSEIRSPQYCPVIKEVQEDEHVFITDELVPVSFVESHRPIHRLLTEIVAILLRQQLGYVDINIHTVDYRSPVNVSRYHPEYRDILLPSATLPFMHMRKSRRPKYMVDMQAWMNPAIPVVSDVYDTKSYLGVGGRFTWFLPSSLIPRVDFLVEHWRCYSVRDGQCVSLFHRTPQELGALRPLLHRADGSPHCSLPFCEGSVYTPSWCLHARCALLFAGDQETGRYLPQQIEEEGLFVKVAYLGPNLNRELIEANMALSDGRSVLVFHWTPSLLLEGLNFTTVDFRPCKMVDVEPNLACYYELHRLNKFIWSRLNTHAKMLYDAINRVSFTMEQFSSLAQILRNSPAGTAIGDVACTWLEKNTDIWMDWRFQKQKKDLFIVGFFPIGNSETAPAINESFSHKLPKKFNDPGNTVAFTMAIDAVNNITSPILQDYVLRPLIFDGACQVDRVLFSFVSVMISLLDNKNWKDVVGIVGPACSDTVEPLAGVAKQYDLPIISYGAEGAIFSDEKTYPNFFRTIPENKIYRFVYYKLFASLNWKRIASLAEAEQGYSEYLSPLHELLELHGMTFINRKYRHSHESMNMSNHLNHLKEQRATVIIGDFYEDAAHSIICQAYHLKMTASQGYVWFLPQWFSDNWYRKSPSFTDAVNCTVGEMLRALEGHMMISYQFFGSDDQVMQENITVKEWYSKYEKSTRGILKEPSDYAGFTYDAVWSFALALDKLSKEDKSFMADLRSTKTMNAYVRTLESIHFHGVSGEVNFQQTHSRTTDINVWQFQNGSYKEVAKFFTDPDNATDSKLDFNHHKLVWPNGKPLDKKEACWPEAVRDFLDLSCYNTRVVVNIFFFLCACSVPSVIIYRFKRKYERKMTNMQKYWSGTNLTNRFSGWQIARENLVLNRKLGEGQYGIIYGGECNMERQGWVPVAAKTLKTSANFSERLEFLSEAELMKDLLHENIVKMLGVCLEGEPVYVVMEFMLHGDLKTYLLARRNLVYNQSRNDSDEISNFRLTSMVRDVASGLQFLADNKYVHRDLACRNCLVNVNKTVKIGDFGMTRLVYETNYYRFSRRAYLPVRWMSPESLIEGVYTSMSDIWSFGVVLYEVITFGTFPFQNMNNGQVLEFVKGRNTLTPPPNIHPLVEGLLLQCWNWTPSRRPTASQIVTTFKHNPTIVTPSLESPQSSVVQGTGNNLALDPANVRSSIRPVPTTASLTRRLSLHPQRQLSLSNAAALPPACNSRQSSMSSASSQNQSSVASSGGAANTVGGLVASLFSGAPNGRKRSMSGNMAVPPITCSLSDTTIGGNSVLHNHTTLDALNLSVSSVVVEEKAEDTDGGTDNCEGGNLHNGGLNHPHSGGETSGYASTGTGTSGSNASSSKHGGDSVAATPRQRRSPDSVPHHDNDGPRDLGLRIEEGIRKPKPVRKNNMFFGANVQRPFIDTIEPCPEDEGSIPLLPKVGLLYESSGNEKRTPALDFDPGDESGGRRSRLGKHGRNSTSSNSSESTTTSKSFIQT